MAGQVTAPLDLVDYAGAVRVWGIRHLLTQPDPEWLIEGMLPETGKGLLVGQWGAAKSLAALDLGLTIASGLPHWFGRRVKPGRVIYHAAEGVYTLKPRIEAWLRLNPRREPDMLIVPDAVNLTNAIEVEQLIGTLHYQTSMGLRLLILDTFNKLTPGSDEKDGKDMSLALSAIDRVGRELGCAMLILHHPPHNQERARGHGSLLGDVDTAWFLKKDDGVHTLRCDKMRAGPEFEPIRFRVTSLAPACVIEPADAPHTETKLRPSAQSALATLRPSPAGLTFTEWQAATRLKDTTFKDAVKALVAGEHVHLDGATYKEGPGSIEGPNGVHGPSGSGVHRVHTSSEVDPWPLPESGSDEEEERHAIHLG